MNVETRNFKMHPKLLMDVIKRQAGSLSKAVLEGVMNGVDAGATRIEITLTPRKLAIADNGRGFENRQQIERFFEVFGQPPEEGERKVYGTFRMGRGQLFAYGRNLWTTNGWRMDVDVNARGLDYDLIQQPASDVAGCTIEVELYEELLPSAAAETQRCVERWCRYVPVAVLFNDRQVNVDPAGEKWDHVTDEAYVRLRKTGVLEVYNLGIHVMDIAGHIYGAGGVVVSRRQLKVNFARNDIQSDCPVWRKIKPLVNQMATRTNTRTKSLNDDARQRLADQIRGGEIGLDDYENLKLKVITGVTGRHFSIDNLLRASAVTVAPLGDPIGERIHLSNRAFVIAEPTLERFGFATARQLVRFMLKRAPDWFSDSPRILDFEKLKSEIDDQYELLPEGELTSKERIWLSLARFMWQELKLVECDGYPQCADRTMHIGQGPAHGWTDASSYVALGRGFLQRQNVDLDGIVAACPVLIHEACHEEADLTAHAHDQAFYEMFHDALHRWQPAMVVKAVNELPRILAFEGKRMTKTQLKRADALAQSRRQAALNSELMAR